MPPQGVESLKRKLQKDSEVHRQDNMRVMQENVSLIREINDLRKEIKDWRSKSGPRQFASCVRRCAANGAWQDTLTARGACGKLVRYPKGEALEGSLVRFCPEPD